MPFNIHPSNEFLKPSEDMGFSLDLRKISSKLQSSSKIPKEGDVLPHSNQIPKDPDRLKSKTVFGPSCSDPSHKSRHDAYGKIQNRESVKGTTATQLDELVKHMSNLPGYLQRTDRGENIQEKALNVGVLDWSRLEKWKQKQKHTPIIASNLASFSSSKSSSSRAATTSSTIAGSNNRHGDKKGLISSSIKSSYKEGLPGSAKLSSQNVKRYQYHETEVKITGDEQRMRPWAFESFGKTQSDASIEREKRKDCDKLTSKVGNFASKSRYHGISLDPNDKADGRDHEAKKNIETLQEYILKEKSSDMGIPSSKSKNKRISVSSTKKMSCSSSEEKKKMDHWQESDIDVGHKQCHSKPCNIVLLQPRQVPRPSSPDDFKVSQIRISSESDNDFAESSQSRLSYVSLPEEAYTEDVFSEIPHSSVLSSVELASSSSVTMQHSVNSLQSEDSCIEMDMLDIELRNQCAFSNTKESLDLETEELTTERGRNLSSNSSHQFRFSLNRIGRSFSFKEGSTLPQFSSTYVSAKSGPVTSESSAYLDNLSKEKADSNNRKRSGPLRRLLDPILKNKASNIHHSAESRSFNTIGFTTINVNESLQAEKSKESSVQALLQLTIKNGVPSFTFVLKNERKVIAATMKSLASPEKEELGCYFTFYLVNEIKKKSGAWISHGSEGKNCGYAYNVIGQMKFSSSKIRETSNQNSKRHCLVKEYVLLGVEIGQKDQAPPKFIHSKELAAVVIEIPCENSSHQGLHRNNDLLKECLKCLAEEGCFCRSGETDISCSTTTVIIPGGVHGSPNKGEPSPLIHRWKSGGLCDCGGWDVGCKLLVLSNMNQSSNFPRSLKSYFENFELFVQAGAEQNTPPLFTLAPLKDGLYSVEFSSTITHLQAFFISVAVLSCQKLPSSLGMSNMHEEISKELSSKNKYNPIPPPSPVGRV